MSETFLSIIKHLMYLIVFLSYMCFGKFNKQLCWLMCLLRLKDVMSGHTCS
jgi:hypothetical protein